MNEEVLPTTDSETLGSSDAIGEEAIDGRFAKIRETLASENRELRVKDSDGDGISVKAKEGLLEIELPRPKVLGD